VVGSVQETQRLLSEPGWRAQSRGFGGLRLSFPFFWGPSFDSVSQMVLLGSFVRAAPGISASPSEENMRYFNVMILGPAQSPYEGAGFWFGFFYALFVLCGVVTRVVILECFQISIVESNRIDSFQKMPLEMAEMLKCLL
jgi:hypothetical protein